jgi:hypothetical protein
MAGGEAKSHLTVTEIQQRLRAAGYTDSLTKIRDHIDRGFYGVEGQDWYRTDTGYRMVLPSAVDAVIARRRSGPDAPKGNSPGTTKV